MKGFNFEKNLNHQSHAVDSTIAVFENISLVQPTEADKNYINPAFDFLSDWAYPQNLRAVQESNGIDEKIKRNSNIIDIMMETGTGKTYTYTKTIFELNKSYGIFKFIVVVPTLSIKAGTIDFLKSDSSREHFKEQYGKTLHLHIVESQKNSKSKKSFIPPAVNSFVNAGNFEKNSIQVMIINAGMINSETMQKSFDKGLFDKYTVPFDAIGATKPFMIIDEPHKFGQGNKTWENIQKMKPQFILRYGATFQGYENLIYTLTAVDSFNRNLVKGVIGHITEFNAGENAIVKFIDSDGTEASFELNENDKRKTVKLKKKDSLQTIHSEMSDLSIENLNKSTVVLSNGLEMKKGDKINPYSYAEKLQETMIQKAIKHHFEIEKQLLTREVKIKPLTLFFIDNIDEYRNKEGYIRKTVEQYIKAEIEELLKTEKDTFYKAYLEKTLIDLSATHAGYFSKDNTEKDEAIEKEINEILHDKQAMLDLENPRRFIFSKWTLREGWDNPNVFQICKLRSSGSEISKLQEVGRGLRLPVNEYGNRVKDEQFYLNYFVDFTESDFVDKLVNEINQKSGAISIEQVPNKLTEQMIKKICELYETTEDELLEVLDTNNVITRTNSFKTGGFDFIKQNYSRIFEGVNSNKVRKATDPKKKVVVRTEKYQELKDLWEKLNEKVILEYKFDNEANFKTLFTEFLKAQKDNFTSDGINERISKVEIKDNKAVAIEPESVYNRKTSTISILKYSDFLKELSKILNINITTLHQSIIDAEIDINKYLNQKTLRVIKHNFDFFLMTQAFDKYSIEYKKVSNSIHPTKLTDEKGNVLKEISASDVGVLFSDEDVADSYFFEELYYDSDLEKTNIKTEIKEVIVFTKIPKNSIKIPVAGGKSYSPDFAYVLKFKDGEQKLNFIVETKDVNNKDGLRDEEKFKIKHAEKFFDGKVKIEFRSQFSNNKIVDLIKELAVDE
ncbi:type III restriction-modification system endonuclease [Ignavibacteria bacterium CHB1]|mgnify:FL=1|nr:MAG: type III restriction-modification system endonuclease [Chlorobiota bacterium]MCC6885242.1 type III restriction-modification system endonuclease [Ignavibacteriales bacterium]MCE7953354.1 type III restriction-modification system endonuclease [Chlorobi bacterium CHB7]MDL1887229.1 type III restriction-modification system endonuclease [Ignavibacteria bacterium CHB1]RIK47723.1 MAG: type III restriction-modification system endonuclease [Ignavibacteriota bacterium]